MFQQHKFIAVTKWDVPLSEAYTPADREVAPVLVSQDGWWGVSGIDLEGKGLGREWGGVVGWDCGSRLEGCSIDGNSTSNILPSSQPRSAFLVPLEFTPAI